MQAFRDAVVRVAIALVSLAAVLPAYIALKLQKQRLLKQQTFLVQMDIRFRLSSKKNNFTIITVESAIVSGINSFTTMRTSFLSPHFSLY